MKRLTNLYLVRHAQTNANLERRFQGRLDIPLNDTGLQQADMIGERFADIPLHAVYTSPLLRAVQTADAIAVRQGLPVIRDEDLIEINGGILENMLFDELRKNHFRDFDALSNAPQNFSPEGGERATEAFMRIGNAVRRLAKNHSGQTVAIVSHGFVLRCALCSIMGYPPEELGKMAWSKNASVSHVVYDGDMEPRVLYMHDDSHLAVG